MLGPIPDSKPPGSLMPTARVALGMKNPGDRTLHELKLETPTGEENPEFLVTMLRKVGLLIPCLEVGVTVKRIRREAGRTSHAGW